MACQRRKDNMACQKSHTVTDSVCQTVTIAAPYLCIRQKIRTFTRRKKEDMGKCLKSDADTPVKIKKEEKGDIPCATCRLRAKFDSNPQSLAGRFWRWHIKFCPGWKAYLASLPGEEKTKLTEKYNLS